MFSFRSLFLSFCYTGFSHKSHARLKELKEYEIVEPKQLTFGQKHRYKRDLTTQINEVV